MKALLAAAAAVVLALGLIGAAVFGAGDRSTFVPPPEAAAEEFARSLAMKRYAIAWLQMAAEARQREGATQVSARFAPVLQQLGKINNVEALGTAVAQPFRAAGESTAHATATIEGDAATATLLLRLVREQGVWKVDRWELAATRS